MCWKKIVGKIFLLLDSLIFGICFPLVLLSIWVCLSFGKVHYDQIVINCCPANLPNLPSYYLICLAVFAACSLFVTILYGLLLARGLPASWLRRFRISGRTMAMLRWVNRLFLALLIELLLWFIMFVFDFPVLPRDNSCYSTCFKERYVHVADQEFHFPEKKMNFIHLVCESLENSFACPEFYEENLLSELTALAENHDSFADCYTVTGTNCTFSSLASSQLAVPVCRYHSFSFLNTRRPRKKKIPFPSCLSLFQLLQKQGYQTAYLCGGDMKYAETNLLYERVPGVRIYDFLTMKADPGYVHLKKKSKWGVNDRVLMKFVRRELLELNRRGTPFAVQISTIDTHFPSEFYDPEESRKFGDFRDVVVDQSRMVAEFVQWLEQQDFYGNTLVVITGDHTAWAHAPSDKQILENAPGFQRTVYNCFINAAVKKKINPELGDKRCWAMFDMMPTVLEAMGVTWQGHRLGVGTSLYSGEKTWLEILGREKYKQEWEKKSLFYDYLE